MKLRPKDWAYYGFQVLRHPAKWFMNNKLNLNLIKNEAKNDYGPYFITGNHITAYDPIIALVFAKPLIKFVGADANLDNGLKSFFFKAARVIPIQKRNMDVRVIRRLMDEVKAGNSVGVFPEGGRTWYGETDKLIYSTAKLIKMLEIRVYVQKLEGAYMTSPRWGRHLHKGVTNVTIYKALEAEEIQNMSADEIFEALKKHLYHNDYEYQRQHMNLLTGPDMAEYIERVIYVCPKCGAVNSFTSNGNHFKCKVCEAKGSVNQYGFIEGEFPYDNLVDWNAFQKPYLTEYLNKGKFENLGIYDVHYKTSSDNGKKEKHLCDCLIDKDTITITYDDVKRVIPVKSISEPSVTFKNTLIFYDKNERHELVIEPFLHNVSIMYVYELLLILRRNLNG